MIVNGCDCMAAFIHVHSLDFRGSVVDGPGVRAVLYVQGCSLHCHGCHNPATWAIGEGQIIIVEKIASMLRKSPYSRLTISGGEPLEQEPAVRTLAELLSDFDLVLYTGREFDDIPAWAFHAFDFIKAGPFIASLATSTHAFIGSTNQLFISTNRQR